jgi:hypothetical protein
MGASYALRIGSDKDTGYELGVELPLPIRRSANRCRWSATRFKRSATRVFRVAIRFFFSWNASRVSWVYVPSKSRECWSARIQPIHQDVRVSRPSPRVQRICLDARSEEGKDFCMSFSTFTLSPVERTAIKAICEERGELLGAVSRWIASLLDDLCQNSQGLAMGRWMLEEAAANEFVRAAPLVSRRRR